MSPDVVMTLYVCGVMVYWFVFTSSIVKWAWVISCLSLREPLQIIVSTFILMVIGVIGVPLLVLYLLTA